MLNEGKPASKSKFSPQTVWNSTKEILENKFGINRSKKGGTPMKVFIFLHFFTLSANLLMATTARWLLLMSVEVLDWGLFLLALWMPKGHG